MAYRVACLTPVSHIEGVDGLLSSIGDVVYAPDSNRGEALLASHGCDVIFVNPNRMTYKIDASFMAPPLKHIITASTGTNHIDISSASLAGVEVHSLAKEFDVIEKISSTAEHAFALTMSMLRKIPASFSSVKSGNWDCSHFIGRQLNSLVFGVVGLGRLGRKYRGYAESFGGTVFFCDPYVQGGVGLLELAKMCDVISLHVHLDGATHGMIGDEFISNCERKPIIVNTSRGAVVDEGAVIRGLQGGKIGGYATDVITDELGSVCSSEIVQFSKNRDDVIITPHVGGATREAQRLAYCSVLSIFKEKLCL